MQLQKGAKGLRTTTTGLVSAHGEAGIRSCPGVHFYCIDLHVRNVKVTASVYVRYVRALLKKCLYIFRLQGFAETLNIHG